MFKLLKRKFKDLVSGLKNTAEIETVTKKTLDASDSNMGMNTKNIDTVKTGEPKQTIVPQITKSQQDVKTSNLIKEKQDIAIEKNILEKEKHIAEKDMDKTKKDFIPQDIVKPKRSLLSGFKEKITTTIFKEDKFLNLFEGLELELLKANVALEVVDALRNNLKQELVGKRFQRSKLDNIVKTALNNSMKSLFKSRLTTDELVSMVIKKRSIGEPFVIVLMGINGSGKTTTAAKLASFFLKHNLKPVLAAADTFRAASIEQLQQHATTLGIPLIKHSYRSDPAAVAYDTIHYAKAKGLDVVLIDTAGRIHTNRNLMEELKKLVRVSKPDLKIFVGEAITGNDCLQQAKFFNETIGIDAMILAKADVDDKGGSVLSVSYVTKKPLLFLGVGQSYDALADFDAERFVDSLLA